MSASRNILAVVVSLILANAVVGEEWMINEDYQQRDTRAATDFEIFLVGDVRNQITGGGRTSVTNPFADPNRTIELTPIGNTKITFTGSNSIPQSLTTNRHFGLYGTGPKPKVRYKAWSYATDPAVVPVPKSNFEITYNEGAQELTITVENISDDTVTFSDVGYLLSPEQHPIGDLTRGVLPPEAFIPLPELNREYLVGESQSAVVPGVPPGMYVVTYATTAFTGSSANNRYNDFGLGTGGEWSQVALGSTAVPAVSHTGLVVLTLLLLGAAAFVLWRGRKSHAVPLATLVFVAWAGPTRSQAWERGNHAGDWTRGATLKVCIDTPPGTPDQQAAYLEAVFEAMAEWNDAQAPFGGLQLENDTSNCDIHIGWQDHASAWGSTDPGTGPVNITVESDDGINSRGVARILKHELGHAEGLGHSAKSALMKADAYSSNPGHAPSAADLNSTDPFTAPTDDDKAGKKALWGTAEKLSKSEATSNASYNSPAAQWDYDYSLHALIETGLTDPVTEFTLDLPNDISMSEIVVMQMPPGWQVQFYDGTVSPDGKQLDETDAPSPSLLSFTAQSPGFGIFPGQTAVFQIASPRGPQQTRAFTSSPSFDSDEFSVAAPVIPVPIPAVSATGLVVLAMALLTAGAFVLLRQRRRRTPAA